MGYTLESFASECHDILADDPGVTGREKVRDLLKQVLVDSTFVAENFSENNDAPRSILYEDDKLGFAICSHVYKREAMSKPHAHGAHWAIYGQVAGQTEMFDYEFIDTPVTDDDTGMPRNAELCTQAGRCPPSTMSVTCMPLGARVLPSWCALRA